MAKKTKTGKIPALKINDTFFKKLGEIIECEVKIREEKANKEIEIETKKRIEEIKKRTYSESEYDEKSEIESIKQTVAYLKRPHISVDYTINNKEERVTFPSVKEVLDTPFFPSKIERFSAHIYHYKGEYVDISLIVNNSSQFLWYGFGGGEYNLSSEDEGKILKIEKDLKSLFGEFNDDYQRFLYPSIKYPYIILFCLSALFSLGVGYFIYTLDPGNFKNLLPLFVFVLYGFYGITIEALKWLFPYYSYELGNRKEIRKILRIAFGIIFTVIILPALFDLVKKIF